MWQVVSADHSGLVRLNNYPAVCAYTPCFAHRGHASHVTRTPPPPQPSAPSAAAAGADGRCGVAGVAFLSDDSRVISCGGSDQATYQWKLRGTYTSLVLWIPGSVCASAYTAASRPRQAQSQ